MTQINADFFLNLRHLAIINITPPSAKLALSSVTRYSVFFVNKGQIAMPAPAERMKTMRDRRRAQGFRELRLTLPDARSASVRQRIALQAARLNPASEADALDWIESVSEFDEQDTSESQ